MKNKFNKQQINEELKRFRTLLEYDFYSENKEDGEIILGSLEEQDEDTAEDIPAEPTADAGVEAEPQIDADMSADMGADMNPEMDQTMDMGGDMGDDMGMPAEEDVEIDVTELVKGSEEAKKSAEEATRNTETLLSKLADLENRLEKMDNISSKMNDLEQQIIKRNPTPVEKLELRSLSSFPYNQKLTDYWGQKHDGYDITSGIDKEEEYTLTNDDINYDYSDSGIKQSFTVNDNSYEEEDI
jgi:hypothetical protein